MATSAQTATAPYFATKPDATFQLRRAGDWNQIVMLEDATFTPEYTAQVYPILGDAIRHYEGIGLTAKLENGKLFVKRDREKMPDQEEAMNLIQCKALEVLRKAVKPGGVTIELTRGTDF